MGATFAYLLGRSFHRSADDCRTLLAAGAGAGLAAVFNALAGSAFVLEELLRKFESFRQRDRGG
jgi:chloride channel protein, CIC family